MRNTRLTHGILSRLALLLALSGVVLSLASCGTMAETVGTNIPGEYTTETISETVTGTIAGTISEAITETIAELQVHFIDVGQGDSTLVVCGGEAMLIDAGGDSKGTTVQLYLQRQGIAELAYVVATHPDSDHIGGLDVILTKFDCGVVIMSDVPADTAAYRDVADAMRYRGYQNTLPEVGGTYALGDAVFTIIAPVGDYPDDNNSSIGIRLVHGDNSFLFTGDAGAEAEEDMTGSGMDISARVLKAGHHGSSTSTSEAFVSAVSPAYAVISCGNGNPYGHPHKEALDVLKDAGVQVFRTDEQGSIVAVSDGVFLSWNTEPSDSWSRGKGKTDGGEAAVPAAGSLPVPEEGDGDITYVINKNTYKFHKPECESVDAIKESNREDTAMSREEVISLGYIPCKRCAP